MSRIVQEKFEVRSPRNSNDDASSASWQTDKSARTRQGLQTRGQDGRLEPYRGDLYNSLPPGMDIEDQEVFKIHRQAEAGDMGTGSQETHDVTKRSLAQGFDRKRMLPTDDMYTREHNDAFYDEVTVDGVTGFVERNNMLDRL